MPDERKAPAWPTGSLPETVSRVVSTIVRGCNPDRIVLFGSAAHGTWGPDSDLDVLVIADSDLPRHRRAAALRLLFDPYPCPLDILFHTPAEVAEWGGATNHVVAEALRTGQVLYERARLPPQA